MRGFLNCEIGLQLAELAGCYKTTFIRHTRASYCLKGLSMDKFQKIILINQYKILSHLEPENKEGYERYIEALAGGYSLNTEWELEWISEDRSKDECLFVLSVLSMFDAIKYSIEHGSLDSLKSDRGAKFQGFDGNDPDESWCIGYVRYLLESEQKFVSLLSELKQGFNSHLRMTDKYKRMLERFDQCNLNRTSDHWLSEEQIRHIIS